MEVRKTNEELFVYLRDLLNHKIYENKFTNKNINEKMNN